MANKPEEFPIFTKLNDNMARELLGKLNLYLNDFSRATSITNIVVHENTLLEIFDRIEKRRVYFHIFYNGCNMSELNEGALLCFWIIKLCPFTCEKIQPDILNAKIAMFLYNKVLSYVAGKTNKQVCITEQKLKDLYYSFRFRDISKEALMLLAGSMIQ
ncbi:MAG: hypothetical protein LBU66_08485 [Treponema sp.]|jgi:hypothetical protein|nr:hypothetical protein [Treponema sp.]